MKVCRSAIGSVIIVALAMPGSASERSDPDLGQLVVEGQRIGRLILDGHDGWTESISDLDEPVTLRAGVYRVREVHLEDGYICPQYRIPKGLSVTVEPNQTATLKIGAPLQHRIEAMRQGPSLILSYKLLGQGGEQYDPRRAGPNNKPGFVIRRGKTEIDSGQFKFG